MAYYQQLALVSRDLQLPRSLHACCASCYPPLIVKKKNYATLVVVSAVSGRVLTILFICSSFSHIPSRSRICNKQEAQESFYALKVDSLDVTIRPVQLETAEALFY